MYRNAVRVLVSHAADAELFRQALPTSQEGIHYAIVHKPLVVDAWLQTGRADTLRGARLRYEATASERAAETVSALLQAAGEEDDEEDVFVMLELLT